MNEKLKLARKLQGWSQGDLAKKITTDARSVGRWERGEVIPSPHYQQKLCEIFAMNAEELGFIETCQQGSLENGQTSRPHNPETERESTLSATAAFSSVTTKSHESETESKAILSPDTRESHLPSDHRNRRLLVGGLLLLVPVTIATGRLISLNMYKKAPFAAPLYTYHASQRLLIGATLFPQAFNDVKWSPDGTYIAGAGGFGVVEVFSTRDRHLHLTYNGHTPATPQQQEIPGAAFAIVSVTWSPDGKYLASGGGGKTVQVWDTMHNTTLGAYRGHTATVTSVAWSPDGRRIASSDRHGIVQVWDAASDRTLLTYKGHQGQVYWVAWSPDGKYLSSGGTDTTVQIWNAETGHPILTYHGHVSTINDVMWSPDGKCIVSASQDMTVQVWDATTGERLVYYDGHSQPARAAGWSPDGKSIASAGDDGTVQIWDATHGKRVFTYDQAPTIWTVAWSPDGKFLASGNQGGTIQIWQKIE